MKRKAARSKAEVEETSEKNPAAVALGKLGGPKGGRKGGPARAAALTPERRREIAKNAVTTRWSKAKGGKTSKEENPSKPAKRTRSKPIDIKSAATSLGSLGGKARAKTLTPEARREIAKKAAATRWAKAKKEAASKEPRKKKSA